MSPITKVATGLVLAFGALRINGFDLLIDPVGWWLCVAGLSSLRRSPADAFGVARGFAIAMICVSTLGLLGALQGVSALAGTLGGLVTVWLIADAVIRRIRPEGEDFLATLLDVLRWAVAGLGALGLVAGYGLVPMGIVVVVAWFVALVALIAVLYRVAGLPCLGGDQRPFNDGRGAPA
ncbi:hypothetical protein HII36_35600 [Nonomuraea sp. NN258]|uniref:hypothetical protein n=1 Tax=Nonomuraea antri TaxID=2730852 RepID=UPI001568351F|nr:hypothetical protein [Nonomuraea antri]NRQ37122.1 hypothetical protein [Nonomuraea antri]